jgi:hypothetical protein
MLVPLTRTMTNRRRGSVIAKAPSAAGISVNATASHVLMAG